MKCNRRYHFVLPSKEGGVASANAVWSSNREGGGGRDEGLEIANIMEGECHLMHGVFHANGFGHLLHVNNGYDKNSDAVLTGSQIMDLWHRICTALRARSVLGKQ